MGSSSRSTTAVPIVASQISFNVSPTFLPGRSLDDLSLRAVFVNPIRGELPQDLWVPSTISRVHRTREEVYALIKR